MKMRWKAILDDETCVACRGRHGHSVVDGLINPCEHKCRCVTVQEEEPEFEVTEENVRGMGWNSPEHDNPTMNARVQADQLHMIGMILLDIRGLLQERASDARKPE